MLPVKCFLIWCRLIVKEWLKDCNCNWLVSITIMCCVWGVLMMMIFIRLLSIRGGLVLYRLIIRLIEYIKIIWELIMKYLWFISSFLLMLVKGLLEWLRWRAIILLISLLSIGGIVISLEIFLLNGYLLPIFHLNRPLNQYHLNLKPIIIVREKVKCWKMY
jgi:hypothetical protein